MSKGKAWYSDKRRFASIPIATNNLIICCGAETEKNYFNGVVKFITEQKQNRLLRFFIEVDAVDPLSMANNALRIAKEVEDSNGCKLDNVWILFDKDDFPPENFNNAINKIHSLSYGQTKFRALWSNQCFELWLLLNFINMQSAINREEYIDKLAVYLHDKYKKNDKYIFNKIMQNGGDITKAINYAKMLTSLQNVPASNDPATTVYEFFEHFSKYLGIDKWSNFGDI